MREKQKTRKLKVYGQSGYKYQDTPTIVLKGKWLENAGFKIGTNYKVLISENQLHISVLSSEQDLAISGRVSELTLFAQRYIITLQVVCFFSEVYKWNI